MAMSVSEASLEIGTDLWRVPVDLVRGAILRGAQVLPEDQRPLYTGFVIGDDRGSREEVVQAFKDSGLSHLLVVSGQNVVFLLAIATPLAARLGRRSNLVVLLSVLLLFAAVTRFEPSVLRACAMAMLAVAGASSGRPLTTGRRIAIAVALLIMIDPLLVESLGFRLSVAATVGIALFASGIARRLRGPEWFKRVLSITIAAQVAVAPLIIPVVGPLPLASLPANVLAEPIAGFVMMWGSTVGVVAGLVGGWPAAILQAPVRLGVWWVGVRGCMRFGGRWIRRVAMTGRYSRRPAVSRWGGRLRPCSSLSGRRSRPWRSCCTAPVRRVIPTSWRRCG
jgi:competence protein ComEC